MAGQLFCTLPNKKRLSSRPDPYNMINGGAGSLVNLLSRFNYLVEYICQLIICIFWHHPLNFDHILPVNVRSHTFQSAWTNPDSNSWVGLLMGKCFPITSFLHPQDFNSRPFFTPPKRRRDRVIIVNPFRSNSSNSCMKRISLCNYSRVFPSTR